MEQSDLVDNTATFAMIMSFSFTQWKRIAVSYFAKCLSAPSTPTKAYKCQEM